MRRQEEGLALVLFATLKERLQGALLCLQKTWDETPTFWIMRGVLRDTLALLRGGMARRYPRLFDLTAIDERRRRRRPGQPASDFTVVYLLGSFEKREHVRLKVPLSGADKVVPTVSDMWPVAQWYEREVWDIFGITFTGHPNLSRLVVPLR